MFTLYSVHCVHCVHCIFLFSQLLLSVYKPLSMNGKHTESFITVWKWNFIPISVVKMESENMKEALNFYSIYDEYFIHLLLFSVYLSSDT